MDPQTGSGLRHSPVVVVPSTVVAVTMVVDTIVAEGQVATEVPNRWWTRWSQGKQEVCQQSPRLPDAKIYVHQGHSTPYFATGHVYC